MIWALLAAHLVLCVILTAFGGALGRRGLLLAAVPPAITTVWATTRLGSGEPAVASLVWVEGLDLEFAFRVDALGALMALLVSGIGALVFVYAAGYFTDQAPGLGPFTTSLLAFSTAMLGLVWSDSVWSLFVFWELTSVTSFLLVGYKHVDPAVRAAARRALLITVAGGLVLLAGLVVLVDATGTNRLSEMPSVTGTSATVASVLLLVAAATKSAQVPFHVWLPGAMAAPTPVSAYLHSATMVKAGVLLVALGGPVLGSLDSWKTLGLVLGFASMLWGAVGALRHEDAKLVLAWGTISQLGLMIALLSIGSAKATFAAVSIVFAHAVFKAALFMVVGEIDIRTGTRRLGDLGGLWRSMPVAFAVAVVSGASMAGVPPLLGFPAKEAAIEAVLGLEDAGWTVAEAWLIGGLVVLGSTLTVAYTVRFLFGVFGSGERETVVAPARSAMAAPSVVLGAASLAGFVALGWVNGVVGPAAERLDPKTEIYQLLRWPGITTAFTISVAVIAVGAMAGWLAHRYRATVPATVGADAVDALIDGAVVLARRITGRIQHGSLPVYVATMAAVTAMATIPFAWSIDVGVIYRWDSPAQAVLAALVVAAAVVAARLKTRLGAALGLGAVGIGVSGLFVVHGAPDLALTQLLVETVVVVGFVIGLGHLTRRFPPVGQQWRAVRLTVAAAAAIGVAMAMAGSASAPTGRPPITELAQSAVDEGGGNNIVNVILTDIRALDTLGEIVVLAVVAVGVAALAAGGRMREAT